MTGFYQPPAERPANNDVSSLIRYAADLGRAMRLLFQGKTNNTGEITLTANSATTTFLDSRLTIDSVVVFDPMTANAKADIPYALTANRNNLQWTLTHANAASTDRTFKYLIVG